MHAWTTLQSYTQTLIKVLWWIRVALWYSKETMQYILVIYCQFVQKKN